MGVSGGSLGGAAHGFGLSRHAGKGLEETGPLQSGTGCCARNMQGAAGQVHSFRTPLVSTSQGQKGPVRQQHFGKQELIDLAEASQLSDKPIKGDGGCQGCCRRLALQGCGWMVVVWCCADASLQVGQDNVCVAAFTCPAACMLSVGNGLQSTARLCAGQPAGSAQRRNANGQQFAFDGWTGFRKQVPGVWMMEENAAGRVLAWRARFLYLAAVCSVLFGMLRGTLVAAAGGQGLGGRVEQPQEAGADRTGGLMRHLAAAVSSAANTACTCRVHAGRRCAGMQVGWQSYLHCWLRLRSGLQGLALAERLYRDAVSRGLVQPIPGIPTEGKGSLSGVVDGCHQRPCLPAAPIVRGVVTPHQRQWPRMAQLCLTSAKPRQLA